MIAWISSTFSYICTIIWLIKEIIYLYYEIDDIVIQIRRKRINESLDKLQSAKTEDERNLAIKDILSNRNKITKEI